MMKREIIRCRIFALRLILSIIATGSIMFFRIFPASHPAYYTYDYSLSIAAIFEWITALALCFYIISLSPEIRGIKFSYTVQYDTSKSNC